MRRLLLPLALLLALALGAPAAAKTNRTNYCSPTGDYCTSTARQGGAVFLTVRTFSFTGRVRICVTDPSQARTCKWFPLRKATGGVYQAKVRWHRNFPNGGAGIYRVRFFYGGPQLGPVLDFRIR